MNYFLFYSFYILGAIVFIVIGTFLLKLSKKELKNKDKFCKYCGKEVIPNTKYCSGCGNELNKNYNDSKRLALNIVGVYLIAHGSFCLFIALIQILILPK